MTTESPPRNGFAHRHRGAIGLATSVGTVVVLVLVYKATTPRSIQDTTATGERIAESEVLQVGAWPAT